MNSSSLSSTGASTPPADFAPLALLSHAPAASRLQRAWAKLRSGATIYLPLILMAALALGTYWLVRITPAFERDVPARVVGHEVDYFMRDFTVQTFDEQGRLKSVLHGAEGRHFADTEVLEIEQVRIRSVNAQGLVTVATAKRAYVNSDGSEVQLTGAAHVVREASQLGGKERQRMEFRGEFLHVFVNDERVTSHLPVVLTRGKDQFSGNTFNYDNFDGVAQLQGRVKGVLVPRTPP